MVQIMLLYNAGEVKRSNQKKKLEQDVKLMLCVVFLLIIYLFWRTFPNQTFAIIYKIIYLTFKYFL